MAAAIPDNTRSSMYVIPLKETFLGEDAPWMFNDIARMICVQATIQFMFAICKPGHNISLDEFFAMMLFVVLGVCVYWLVFRKVVAFD